MTFLLGRSFKCRADIKRVVTVTQLYCSSVVSGRLRVNGVDLYYEQTGRGKHAVLFFPGSLGSTQTNFIPQMKLLNKERFTLVNWDPRGYGRSRPPARDFPPDFLERDAKDGVDLMKALGYDKFSVVGWSAGGLLSLIAAAKNPDLINQLVVFGSIAFLSQKDIPRAQEMRDVSRWEPWERKQEEDVYGAEYLAKTWNALMDAFFEIAKSRGGNVCMELLPLISCPTLIIHGEEDEVCNIIHPQTLHKHIKGSRFELVPGGGHALHLKHVEKFNKLLEDFLED